MAKVKISELPSLSPATLDTTFVVGISGSTTYKISINQLTSSLDTTFATDLVTAALSSSLNSKLSTSSYSTDSASFNSRIISGSAVAGTISGSAQISALGFLSTSTDLSLLNTISASYLSFTQSYYSVSASFDNRVDSLENATSSYLTSLNGAISGAGQISDLGFVTGSYTTINSFNNLTQSFNSISQSFTTISGSFGDIDFSGINSITSSYLSFTQSYYSASASVDSRITTEKNRIDAILSASNANTDTFAEVVSLINSVDLTNDNAFATFYTASNGRITSLENATSSYLTSLNGAISSSTQVLNGSGIFSSSAQLPNGLISSSAQLPSNLVSGSSQISTLGFITGSYISSSTYTTDSSSFNSRIISGSAVAGTISSSAQISAFGFVSGAYVSSSTYTTDSSSFNSRIISGSAVAGTISGSSQIAALGYATTSSVTTISASAWGAFQSASSYSSSLQTSITSLSSSVDTRLDTLEATIITGSPNYIQVLGNQRVASTPGTSIISGSITTSGNPVQIIVTGDANPTATTGQWCTLQIYRDNSAIGGIVQVEAANNNENQAYCLNVIDTPSAGTYTYSLRMVTNSGGSFQFGEASGPTLTAVELKTNTNLPSTNNTFTGTNTFKGAVNFNNGIGAGATSEGGQINLGLATQNQTLTGSVVIDVYENRLRLFEESGNNRGVFVDLSKASAGVGGELMWKASGLLNTGSFVQLDNIKAGPTRNGAGGGFAGLSIAAVSTTFVADISATYSNATIGGTSATGVTYTTTASNSAFGWGFTQGHQSTYILNDTTNSRVYRITLMVGASYNNNFTSIERLY